MECNNYQLKTAPIECENIENLKCVKPAAVSFSVKKIKNYQFTVKYCKARFEAPRSISHRDERISSLRNQLDRAGE